MSDQERVPDDAASGKRRLADRLLDLMLPLVRVDKESARAWVDGDADGVVFVWSANAIEQIEAFIQRECGGPDSIATDELVRTQCAGDALAARAAYVCAEYDGIHRLRMALADWFRVRGTEFGRGATEESPR